MTATFRHVRRTGDVIIVKVHPNDGRDMDEFRATPAELRRFAWALLADLDPEEAAVAAAESGLSVAALAAQVVPMRGRPPHAGPPRAPGPPPMGTKKYQLLTCLADGPRTIDELQALHPHIARPRDLLWELAQSGLVNSTAVEGSNRRKTYDLTPAGRDHAAGRVAA
jgi:hypothetical protein